MLCSLGPKPRSTAPAYDGKVHAGLALGQVTHSHLVKGS
uniref:Uncharacterized protein n=1 Tax=Arundo donax TaxID=35708 RepID=A0A0A8YK22_ARUDO